MRDGLPLACAPRSPCSGLRYFAGRDHNPFHNRYLVVNRFGDVARRADL
jgi:hypothetical protein